MSELTGFFSGDFWSMYFFSCSGAILLWMRLKADLRDQNSLAELFDAMLRDSEGFAMVGKFMFFIMFGGFVGVLFVEPATPVQAATAGIAWSRIAAKD